MCDFYTQDQLQKRLGDGFCEQSLVRDQVVKATGQRYLSGYSDDESQYRALLSSGKSFSERFNISPGADLSADQMAQVTADMVLMVNQTVTLPDGSTQVVSVPKLYARVHPGDLQGGGTLLAGNCVRINTADKVINSGSINGRELTAVSAGNDITLDTAKTAHATDYTRNSNNYDRTQESREIGSVVSAGGSLLIQAGRDMNLRAADVTATGDATLLAGNTLIINKLTGHGFSQPNAVLRLIKRKALFVHMPGIYF